MSEKRAKLRAKNVARCTRDLGGSRCRARQPRRVAPGPGGSLAGLARAAQEVAGAARGKAPGQLAARRLARGRRAARPPGSRAAPPAGPRGARQGSRAPGRREPAPGSARERAAARALGPGQAARSPAAELELAGLGALPRATWLTRRRRARACQASQPRVAPHPRLTGGELLARAGERAARPLLSRLRALPPGGSRGQRAEAQLTQLGQEVKKTMTARSKSAPGFGPGGGSARPKRALEQALEPDPPSPLCAPALQRFGSNEDKLNVTDYFLRDVTLFESLARAGAAAGGPSEAAPPRRLPEQGRAPPLAT